jgi:DNA-binding NarL/FixJ family response regulator
MVSRLARMENRPVVQTLEPLTSREKRVLALVVEGLPNKAIAMTLGSSESTVKAHLREVFRKLDVDSRAAAAAKASRLDLESPEDPGHR